MRGAGAEVAGRKARVLEVLEGEAMIITHDMALAASTLSSTSETMHVLQRYIAQQRAVQGEIAAWHAYDDELRDPSNGRDRRYLDSLLDKARTLRSRAALGATP